MSTGIEAIAAERRRQIEVEGWTPEHDDQNHDGDMSRAAACYALSAAGYGSDDRIMLRFWPWVTRWWTPKSRRVDLIRAGALIVAEIDRLDRAAVREAETSN
jgi:hypothetical protein